MGSRSIHSFIILPFSPRRILSPFQSHTKWHSVASQRSCCRGKMGILQSNIEISNLPFIDFHNWINFNQWTIEESRKGRLRAALTFVSISSKSFSSYFPCYNLTWNVVKRWCWAGDDDVSLQFTIHSNSSPSPPQQPTQPTYRLTWPISTSSSVCSIQHNISHCAWCWCLMMMTPGRKEMVKRRTDWQSEEERKKSGERK